MFNDSVLNVVGAFDVNAGVYSHFGVDRSIVAFGFHIDVFVDVVVGLGIRIAIGVDVDVDVDVVVCVEIHVSCWCQSRYSF